MNKTLIIVFLAVIIVFGLFACDALKSSSPSAPSFIEVGKVYFIYTSVALQLFG